MSNPDACKAGCRISDPVTHDGSIDDAGPCSLVSLLVAAGVAALSRAATPASLRAGRGHRGPTLPLSGSSTTALVSGWPSPWPTQASPDSHPDRLHLGVLVEGF